MRSALLLLVTFTLLIPPSSALAEGRTMDPFGTLSYEQALQSAKTQGKQVLIYFGPSWHSQSKRMETDTWKDDDVRTLLVQKTVSVRIDPEKEAFLARRYGVTSYPSVVILDSKGEYDRKFTGFMSAQKFLQAMMEEPVKKKSVKGKDGVDKQGRRILTQETYGELYRRAARQLAEGNDVDALDCLLQCFDAKEVSDAKTPEMQRNLVLAALRALAERSLPAMESLEQRRDSAREAMLEGPENLSDAQDFALLNRVLDNDVATLREFDALSKGDPRRVAMGFHVYGLLLNRAAYADALEAYPDSQFEKEFGSMESRLLNRNGPSKRSRGSSTLQQHLVRLGAMRAAALGGLGRDEDLRRLVARVLVVDSSEEARDTLAEALSPVGLSFLVEEMR